MSTTYVDGTTPLDAAHMNALQQKVEKAAANGYASLDSGGKVPLAQLPPVGADLIYDGDFAAGPTYKDGEIVVYQDASGNKVAYMCTSPTTNAPTPWPGGPPTVPAYPRPTYGTTLPASPVDGQEHILVDSATNPSYQWHFRYNASSSSAYKWEFVGGSPKVINIPTAENTSSTGATDLATVQAFTLPRAGDWFARVGAQAVAGAAVAAYTGAVIASADMGVSVGVGLGVAGYGGVLFREGVIVNRNAGDVLKQQYWLTVATLTTYNNRCLSVQPVRVS